MTTTQELTGKVRELIGQMSPLGETEASSQQRLIEDLGYDSVSFLELALAIESEFDIFAVDEEQAANLVTVGDIETLVVTLSDAG
ncbi:acyl carrier protein [Jatrophihabitans endophyticus]|uniref:Acyl carrier protein n=1 Tax=Jatrophihabitans endophyticus TaxID=1206085 RepID=A0A1M5RCM3_9ACTN|nr:phosphopantetheine-binding protein [Jatrophihabitans endophyticus]SHH24112.1 acyl carrier protein [Jatrophihabitans endophyticus]